jgi:succinyl-CoA synthetase beta subunit
MIAEGIIAAVKEVGVKVPVVVRLEGTNVEQGRQAAEESGLDHVGRRPHRRREEGRRAAAAA